MDFYGLPIKKVYLESKLGIKKETTEREVVSRRLQEKTKKEPETCVLQLGFFCELVSIAIVSFDW